MPVIQVSQKTCSDSEPEWVGQLSHAVGDSLHEARERIDKFQLVDYPYDFWHQQRRCRHKRKFEKGSFLEDLGGEVIIIPCEGEAQSPLPGLGVVTSCEVSVGLPSSHGSGTDVPSPDASILSKSFPPPSALEVVSEDDPISIPSNLVTSDVGTVELSSKLMSEDHSECWVKNAEKLKNTLEALGFGDHLWSVRTWDEEQKPAGRLRCLECKQDMALASMEKASINNSFNNFKNHHLRSKKHHVAWCARRKIKPSAAEIAAKQQVNVLDNSSTLSMHVKILERINLEESGEVPPFYVIGDLERRPILLFYYRVGCHVCKADIACLIPQQRNLEYNLREHLASQKHRMSLEAATKKDSGKSILSGRPGRPPKVDGRDLRQKTIHGFFGSDEGRPGSSGGCSQRSEKGKGTDFDLECGNHMSQLCWGLWQQHVKWSGSDRVVKGLLMDQQGGVDWYAEPFVECEVYCISSGEIVNIRGLFRHKDCSRVAFNGSGFLDLTCEKCWDIKLQTDFRLRVLREGRAQETRGERNTIRGRRLDYLTIGELKEQARSYSRGVWENKQKVRRLEARICMLRSKIPSLREVLGDAAGSKDIAKFCRAVVLAHNRGAFGGKSALWDMLQDIVLNLNRKSAGKRYSKGTKAIAQALLQHGGRRVIDCLAVNMLGPSLNTLQRDRRGMSQFRAGIHAEQFKFVAKVYGRIKERLGIAGDLPCMLSEDETAVKRTVRWVQRLDCLIGFCGAKDQHSCGSAFEVVVGDAEVGFKTLVDAFEANVIGNMARCVIVNPLHVAFPRLCILAMSTCNSFNAEWVRSQWENLMSSWNEHCRAVVGPVIGHASDGDPRRRKLMVEAYTGKGSKGPRVEVGWEGWLLSYAIAPGLGDPYGLHDQDYIHNGKKLVNPLDSPVKVLKLGAWVATLAHLHQIHELYPPADHLLNREDILRTDRQNWSSAQRLCSLKVQECLKQLQNRDDARAELTLGTEMYLQICSDYIAIFLDVRLSLVIRVQLCSKVSFFFRLWRLWLLHGDHKVGGNTQTLSMKNFVSMQTFLDIQMSVHYVVLLIVTFRDRYPTLPIPFHLTGSDSCEQFFSKVGGMKGHERSYDFGELIDSATGLNRLAELELTEGVLGVGKSHKKHKNIWLKLHPLLENEKEADLSDFSGLLSNSDVVEALKQGFAMAQDVCVRLEMCPTTSAAPSKRIWFKDPWKLEAKGVSHGGWCTMEVPEKATGDDDFADGIMAPVAVSVLDPAVLLDGEGGPLAAPNGEGVETVIPTGNSVMEEDDGQQLGDDTLEDGASDMAVAEGEMRHCFGDMMGEMILETDIKPVDPTVSFDGKRVYKSTLVSQLVGNPTLSKDRLTRVKQSIYFNNLVDKPRDRAGARTMFMHVGSDVGVYFLQQLQSPSSRATKSKRGKSASKSPNTPVGRAAPVVTVPSGEKAVWWLGRVQVIRKKYAGKWGRSREPVDLLDRPVSMGDGPGCEVQLHWFSPLSKSKFKYNMVDPQWISLDSIISVVTLQSIPNQKYTFNLDEQDCRALEDFVKSKLR